MWSLTGGHYCPIYICWSGLLKLQMQTSLFFSQVKCLVFVRVCACLTVTYTNAAFFPVFFFSAAALSWSARNWPARRRRCSGTTWWWVHPLLSGWPWESSTPDWLSLCPQYYEMSYGLNIEMHKQVGLLSSQIFLFAFKRDGFIASVGVSQY